MRICLIAEGCYPYVAGGVSSWIQMLIKGLPEYEFIIYAIGAQKSQKGEYKYQIPDNVVEIHEIFLDEFLQKKGSRNNRKLNSNQLSAIISILRGELKNWDEIFNLFHDYPANDFLMSDDFLDVIKIMAKEEYKNVPFKDAFWAARSMLIPLLNMISCPIPEADIYHSVSTGYAGVLGSMFKYYFGKPFIVTEHGIYSREREEEILKASWVSSYFKKTWINFFNSLCLCAYHSADKIVSLYYGARNMQIHLGAPEEKCRVIPNGVNMERFKNVKLISDVPHPLTIGAILRIVPIKDVKTMIYSFNIVKNVRKDAILYLIGPYDEDPEYYRECKELINNLELSDVHFVGRVKVDDWMEKLDLVLLTSISEGQPFVLLEAMAAHRPVLATRVGSCFEIIEGFPDEFGSCGAVLPVMNPSAIAKGILDVAKSYEHMRTLAENGYKRVEAYYRECDFLNNYRKLYMEVKE